MRPDWDDYYIKILDGIKERASCPRKQCGAIIVDEQKILLSTGYNGPPSKLTNCTEVSCGAELDESGNTENCLALHAEHNAIYFARDKIEKAHTMYCTYSPCLKCALEILQTPIKQVIFMERYSDQRGLLLLNKALVNWRQHGIIDR